MASAPVERKVSVATGTALISAFVIGLVSHYVFKDSDVPVWLTNAIDGAIIAAITFVSSWMAKHTYRPGEAVMPVAEDGSAARPEGYAGY